VENVESKEGLGGEKDASILWKPGIRGVRDRGKGGRIQQEESKEGSVKKMLSTD